MTVTNDFDLIPHNQRAGYRLTGWLEKTVDGVKLRTNVKYRVNGRSVPLWPDESEGLWLPEWVTVAD